MKQKHRFHISIPASLKTEYTILEIISSRREQCVLKIQHRTSEQLCVLKIRFSTLPALQISSDNPSASTLLLPFETIQETVFTYEIYPFMESLADYIQNGKPVTISFLLSFICDSQKSLCCIHEAGYAHGDIAVRNFFVTLSPEKGNPPAVFLGDFSSIQSANPNAFLKDLADFSHLLLLLLNHGNLLTFHELNQSAYPLTSQFLLEQIEKQKYKNSASYFCALKQCIQSEQHTNQSENYDFYAPDACIDFCFDVTVPALQNTVSSSEHSHHYPLIFFLIISISLFLWAFFSFYFSNPISKTSHNTKSVFTTSSPGIFSQTPHSPAPVSTFSPAPSAQSQKTSDISYIDISNKGFTQKTFHSPAVTKQNIRIVIAPFNHFTSPSPFLSYRNIEELYLDNNCITSLKQIAYFRKLRILNISNNKISDVRPITKLSALNVLDLSGNHRLTHIKQLNHCQRLTHLIVTDTNITLQQIKYLEKALPHCIIYS